MYAGALYGHFPECCLGTGRALRQAIGPGDERGEQPGRGLAAQGRIISCCRNPLDTPSPCVLMFESGKAKQGGCRSAGGHNETLPGTGVYHGLYGARTTACPPRRCTFYDGAFFVGQISVVCRECLWLVLPGGGAMPRRV